MVTLEQATAERAGSQEGFKLWEHTEFHIEGCSVITGIRGGVKTSQVRFRRSGKTQTWKTKPGQFRIPIKYGLKFSTEITEANAHKFHTYAECPLNK